MSIQSKPMMAEVCEYQNFNVQMFLLTSSSGHTEGVAGEESPLAGTIWCTQGDHREY